LKKPLIIAAIVFAGLCVSAVVLGVFGFVFGSKIGCLSPAYHAVDGDPYLTGVARSALPVIRALREYQSDHREFPTHVTALTTGYLPEVPTTPDPKAGDIVLGWSYHCDSAKKTYSLSHGLGWDPSLIYSFDGGTGHWKFDPGDGKPVQTIQLNP